jgi:hypothetical protein
MPILAKIKRRPRPRIVAEAPPQDHATPPRWYHPALDNYARQLIDEEDRRLELALELYERESTAWLRRRERELVEAKYADVMARRIARKEFEAGEDAKIQRKIYDHIIRPKERHEDAHHQH